MVPWTRNCPAVVRSPRLCDWSRVRFVPSAGTGSTRFGDEIIAGRVRDSSSSSNKSRLLEELNRPFRPREHRFLSTVPNTSLMLGRGVTFQSGQTEGAVQQLRCTYFGGLTRFGATLRAMPTRLAQWHGGHLAPGRESVRR